ncbi:MAG: hypothetical protein WC903_06635 [Candidatus Margulisiibacteriota bacterium]
MNKNQLLIIEDMNEAKQALRELELNDWSVLALNPNIRSFLAQNNIISLDTSDIIDTASFQLVMEKCAEIESSLRGELDKSKGRRPEDWFVNASFYYLVLIWRHLLWNIELLDKCLAQNSYSQIAAFKHKSEVTLSPWVEDNQLYLGRLAEKMCTMRAIGFVPLKLSPWTVQPMAEKFGQSRFNLACNWVSSQVLKLAAALLKRRRTLLVPSFKYNLDRVCDDLRKEENGLAVGGFYNGREGLMEVVQALGILVSVLVKRKIKDRATGYPLDFIFPIKTFARANIGSYEKEAPKEYSENIMGFFGKNNDVLTYMGVNISGILTEKIRSDLAPYLLGVHYLAFGLEKALEAIRPTYVISQMNLEVYGALGEITKKFNIPSVLISHGSHVLHTEKYAAREHEQLAKNILVGHYRYSAVQSPHAGTLALKMLADPDRLVNIQPTLWGRRIEKANPAERSQLTVVHAGTFKMRHNRRYIYETADEYVKALQELAAAVAGRPRIKLIVKFRQNDYELTLEALKRYLPPADNVIIETERSFLDVLAEADLIVSFSSTTIEEALSNKVPVLLYGGEGRYAHIPGEPFSGEIGKAVLFVPDRIALQQYFDRLDEAGLDFKVPAKEFQRHRFGANETVDFPAWLLKQK